MNDLLTVGNGGLECKEDFVLDATTQRELFLVSEALLLLLLFGGAATGLAGCDRLCSGAWNVYTVNAGLWWPFS